MKRHSNVDVKATKMQTSLKLLNCLSLVMKKSLKDKNDNFLHFGIEILIHIWRYQICSSDIK